MNDDPNISQIVDEGPLAVATTESDEYDLNSAFDNMDESTHQMTDRNPFESEYCEEYDGSTARETVDESHGIVDINDGALAASTAVQQFIERSETPGNAQQDAGAVSSAGQECLQAERTSFKMEEVAASLDETIE